MTKLLGNSRIADPLPDPLTCAHPESHFIKVIDRETFEEIEDVILADREHARLTVYVRDRDGKLVAIEDSRGGHYQTRVQWRHFVLLHTGTGDEYPSA